MGDNSHRRRRSRHPAAATTAVAVLFVICIVECATEQRINRGSPTSNLIAKQGVWRTQRGANCLQYGHSCWGGHGKRSGLPRARDYFLSSLLHRIMNTNDLDRRQTRAENDINALFGREAKDVSETNNDGSAPEMVSNGDEEQLNEDNQKEIIKNLDEFLAVLRSRARN